MDLFHPQLAAFVAVLEEGSFEAAARRLSVTPSAVSQRIKALEERLGQPLVIRQIPCRPTPSGERLLRRARPMQALAAEAIDDLRPDDGAIAAARPIAIAVNDDSLETWLLPALARLHDAHGYRFDLRVDDQDHTLDLLRRGAVLGAVTAAAAPLQGCQVRPLGVMRYHAIASPAVADRWFAGGPTAAAFAAAPMIVFNRKDELQWRLVRRITRARLAPPIHYLPSSTGVIEAAALGLGWCLAPAALIGPALAEGRISLIAPDYPIDVALYWQQAAVRSTLLKRVADALAEAAARPVAIPGARSASRSGSGSGSQPRSRPGSRPRRHPGRRPGRLPGRRTGGRLRRRRRSRRAAPTRAV